MIENQSWIGWFNIVRDIIIIVIYSLGLKALFYAKKQLEIVKDQTKEARDQFRINNERNAITLAINISEKFAIIMVKFNKLIRENGENIAAIEKFNTKFKDDMLKEKHCYKSISEDDYLYYFKLCKSFSNDLLLIANDFEGIALAFVNRVADEKSVFNSLAPSYCKIIEILYPIITHFRCIKCGDCAYYNFNDKNNVYNNSLELYKTWKSRLLKVNNASNLKNMLDMQAALEKQSKSKPIFGSQEK
ncbi:MAG: hypothetical protein K9J13_15020 [Saprospiraceae bacterium]|nr:hypothetical protein [Saprospiraceae bacterium]